MIDQASPAALWEGRATGFWREHWRVPELLAFDAVSSTNDVARAAAARGAPAGTIVLADHQTAGRGRFGRRWLDAPRSALLLSIVLRPQPISDPAPGALPLRIGLAAARAIEATTRVAAALKWPNDIVLTTGAKLGGILCEAATTDSTWTVIAGIGINISQPDDWPPALHVTAAALETLAGHAVDRAGLAGTLIDTVRPLFDTALTPLDEGELRAFALRDLLAGRPLHVRTPDRADGTAVLDGTGAGIDAEGALLVQSGGQRVRVTTGSVRLASAGGLAASSGSS